MSTTLWSSSEQLFSSIDRYCAGGEVASRRALLRGRLAGFLAVMMMMMMMMVVVVMVAPSAMMVMVMVLG